MVLNTSIPAVGAFPKKVTEVSALKANASKAIAVTVLGIVRVAMELL